MTELVLPRVRRRRIKPPHPWWLLAVFFSSVAVLGIGLGFADFADWHDAAFIVSCALYLRCWSPQLRSYSRLVPMDGVGTVCWLAGVALSITATLA